MPFMASLSMPVDLRKADSICYFIPEENFSCIRVLSPIKGIPAKATKVVLHSYLKDNMSPNMILENNHRMDIRIFEVKWFIFLQSRSMMVDSSADEFSFLSKKATSIFSILSKDSWRIFELTSRPILLKKRFSTITNIKPTTDITTPQIE